MSRTVAQEIKKELKTLYPSIKFSVVQSSYSAVRIKYSFGVSTDVIQSICSKYEMGDYDGSEDIYKYTNRNPNIPQCEYVFVERSETWNELQKLAKYVSKKFNVDFHSNVRDIVGYRWLDCLNDIELIENEEVESMYARVEKEAIRQGLLFICETNETVVEPEVKEEIQPKEYKECVCPKCGNINKVETQWLNMLCMKCDYDTDNDDTVKFINGEIIKNDVHSNKWEKLNKEFDEKMSSISDDEMSKWIDKNKELNMSVKDVVEKMIDSDVIGCDIQDDIQADEICYNTQEMLPQVVLQCPNCSSNNTVVSGQKDFTCVKCGVSHEIYETNGEIKVLNITDENVKISKEKYNTSITYIVEKPINIEEYKNGYIINGTADRYVVIEKLSEIKLNRFVKEIIKSQIEDMKDSRCVIFKNPIQCFTECGRMMEVFETILYQNKFIEIMENEKVEIGDILYLTNEGVIIQSPKRNCIIIL